MRIFLVLAPGVYREDAEEALEAAGLECEDVREATDEKPTHISVWRNDANDVTVTYFEDQSAGYNYLKLEGEDLESVTRELVEELPVDTTQSIGERLASADDEVVIAEELHRLATLHPDFDPGVMAVLGRHLTSDQPVFVRRAALRALMVHVWPEALILAERVKNDDPSEQVRSEAALFLRLAAQAAPAS